MKTFGLKIVFMVGVIGLLLAMGGTGADAALTQDYDDMWDMTSPHSDRITIISAGPDGLIFPAANTFGSTNLTNPQDSTLHTIFVDRYPAGTVDYVEWQTQAPVTLAEFHLFGARDGLGIRQFSAFDLYYKDNTQWVLIKHLDTDSLYGQYDPDSPNYLAVSVSDFTPVTAQAFRYEVVQTGPGGYWDYSGPRVVELDGYSTRSAVPLPGAVWLLGSGLLSLGGISRWRRRRS